MATSKIVNITVRVTDPTEQGRDNPQQYGEFTLGKNRDTPAGFAVVGGGIRFPPEKQIHWTRIVATLRAAADEIEDVMNRDPDIAGSIR